MLSGLKNVIVFISMSLLVLGCGSAPAGPATVATVGTVTLKGQPLSGATVAFRPSGAGRSCDAVTDSKGHFELQTYLENGDAKPGVPSEHQVTILKLDESNLPIDSPPKNLVPAKYAQTTSLRSTNLKRLAKAMRLATEQAGCR